MSLLKKHAPETFKALSRLVSETIKEGVLSVKIKELLAVVLSIAVHCEPCIKIHLKRAFEAGATEESGEILIRYRKD
jgi:AhpD family alkylhydroperoxidase